MSRPFDFDEVHGDADQSSRIIVASQEEIEASLREEYCVNTLEDQGHHDILPNAVPIAFAGVCYTEQIVVSPSVFVNDHTPPLPTHRPVSYVVDDIDGECMDGGASRGPENVHGVQRVEIRMTIA